MITIIVFGFFWILLGGNGDALREMTQSEQALFFLIVIASDLNFIFGRK